MAAGTAVRSDAQGAWRRSKPLPALPTAASRGDVTEEPVGLPLPMANMPGAMLPLLLLLPPLDANGAEATAGASRDDAPQPWASLERGEAELRGLLLLGALPALLLDGSSCSSSLPSRRPASVAAAVSDGPPRLPLLWVRRAGTPLLVAAAPLAVPEVLPVRLLLLLVRRMEGDRGRILPDAIPVAAGADAGANPSPCALRLPPAPWALPCRASKDADGGLAEVPLLPRFRYGPWPAALAASETDPADMLRPSTRAPLLLPPAAAPRALTADDEDELDEYSMPADSGLPPLVLLPLPVLLLLTALAGTAALLLLPVPPPAAVLPLLLLVLLLLAPYALPGVPTSPAARPPPALLELLAADAWGADEGRLLTDGDAETCGSPTHQ